LVFSSAGVTSGYHVFAGGLDWSRPVGLVVYADGSGEYGLEHPGSRYLLGGADGLVAVAKRQNMVLVTPRAPGGGCPDGDGVCWYQASSGITAVQKARWAEELVLQVLGDYPIDRARVAVGGYSSGAQLATRWWVPSGAAQRTMDAGVVVAISYGGVPDLPCRASAEFRAAVHLHWDVGAADPAYDGVGRYGVTAGHAWYTSRGFRTSLSVAPGVGHDRDGEFGAIMEAQIQRHLGPGASSRAPRHR
jgi:poly(3-hydroxybutyrate) depolymerase